MGSLVLPTRLKGFTLIEVMIVVVIVAILASIAIPAYTSQMIKSRRVDVQREIVSHAQALERYFTTNGSYVSSGTTCGVADPAINKHYTVTTTCSSATAFSIKASPSVTGPQSGDGDLTVDQSGARTPTDKW